MAMHNVLVAEAARHMAHLPYALQEKVLSYIKELMPSAARGLHGRNLLKYAGTISCGDLQTMSEAIEERCGRIDRDEW
jgi:hypothetical protein